MRGLNSLSQRPLGPTPGFPRLSKRARWLAGVGSLAVLALLAAALIPTLGGSHPSHGSVEAVAARGSSANTLPVHETKVFGAAGSAKNYSTQIALQENEGVDTNGQLTSDLPPIPPSAFDPPIAVYRAYAERWAARLAAQLPALRAALASGSRGASERAWKTSYSDYLQLGAVYGLLPGTLDAAIDGVPHNLGSSSGLTGLHRIEKGLWTGASPRSLAPYAAALEGDVVVLRRVLPAVQITPLDYATRAHEILEDAQRDLLSGSDVPWSGAGVLGTEAGIAATREVIGTLTPLLQGRDNTLVVVDNWLAQLQSAFERVRAEHGGRWPALSQLTEPQQELLNGTLAGALVALSQVPGTLETAPIPVISSIGSTK